MLTRNQLRAIDDLVCCNHHQIRHLCEPNSMSSSQKNTNYRSKYTRVAADHRVLLALGQTDGRQIVLNT
jgi:hypothetical protein